MTPTPQPESSSAAPASTVETREIITLCRQMGNMMQAGVDILRITRVLRSQTKNPALLEFYEAFDHDLRLGRSVADAMANAPELFSPFAVSLVQEGEERNDIAGSLFKIADFLQSEEAIGEWAEVAPRQEAGENNGAASAIRYASPGRRSIPVPDNGVFQESLWRLFASSLRTLAVLLFVESIVAAVVAAGVLPTMWWPTVALLLAAATIAESAWWFERNNGNAPQHQQATSALPGEADVADGGATRHEGSSTPGRSMQPAASPVAPDAAKPTVQAMEKSAEAAPVRTEAREEEKVVWPTAEEENATYSKVWQRPAPQEEQYD